MLRASGFSCNLRLVANSCNLRLWLPACLPACHDSHVSHWGRICHQPCGGAAALKKCTHNLAFNRAEKKNYKIVFMLRLFYSRFNTLERTGYYGSVMEWVENSNNSYIGKAELLMSTYFRKFLKVHTKHVTYIFLLFFQGYVTVGRLALIALLALVFYKLLFCLYFLFCTRGEYSEYFSHALSASSSASNKMHCWHTHVGSFIISCSRATRFTSARIYTLPYLHICRKSICSAFIATIFFL